MRQGEILFYVLLIVALLCGYYYQNSHKALVASTHVDEANQSSKPDTARAIIKTSFAGTTFPVVFEAAFHQKTLAFSVNDSLDFRVYEIGKLKIESGYLIACDPIVMNEGVAFTQRFPVGQFSVQLAMAKWAGDERVAFSRILFSNEPVAHWSFALTPGQKPLSLRDSTVYCYGVDGGAGVFIDKIANRVFAMKSHRDWEYIFIKKAEENGYKGFIHNFDQHNLATFSTGMGDGCYATYIGYDEKGRVCRLLTDFGLVNW